MVAAIASSGELVNLGAGERFIGVFFRSPDCVPCDNLHRSMNDLAKEFDGISFYTVDVLAVPDASTRMGVSDSPTLVFYQMGKEVLRTSDLNWFLGAAGVVNTLNTDFKENGRVSYNETAPTPRPKVSAVGIEDWIKDAGKLGEQGGTRPSLVIPETSVDPRPCVGSKKAAWLPRCGSAAIKIHLPPKLYHCQAVKIKFTGGDAPYHLTVYPLGDPDLDPLEILSETNWEQLQWTPKLDAGTKIALSVTDKNKKFGYSKPLQIMAGNDTSCLGTAMSEAYAEKLLALEAGSASPPGPVNSAWLPEYFSDYFSEVSLQDTFAPRSPPAYGAIGLATSVVALALLLYLQRRAARRARLELVSRSGSMDDEEIGLMETGTLETGERYTDRIQLT